MRTTEARYTIGQRYSRNATGNGYRPATYGEWHAVTLRYKRNEITILVDRSMVDRMIVRRVIGSAVFCLADTNPRYGTASFIVLDMETEIRHGSTVDIGDGEAYDLTGTTGDLFFQGEEWTAFLHPDMDPCADNTPDPFDLDDLTVIRRVIDYWGEVC
jgi:hypothetical protein